MAVRGESEASLMPDLKASIALNALFAASGLVLAGAQIRTTLAMGKPRARVTSALLWSTIILFVVGYVAMVAASAYAWTHVPRVKTGFYWTNIEMPFALTELIELFPGLSNLLAIVACRTFFYEFIEQGRVSLQHAAARRVFLGFDITILLLGLGMLVGTVAIGRPCCMDGGGDTPGQFLMTSVFDYNASLGFQYFLFASYVMTWIACGFASKWSKQHGVGVATAARMAKVLCPVLALEFIFLLITTIIHFDGDIQGSDFLDFYVSIPWRIGQVAIIAVLIWLTSFPLAEGGDIDASLTQHAEDLERQKE